MRSDEEANSRGMVASDGSAEGRERQWRLLDSSVRYPSSEDGSEPARRQRAVEAARHRLQHIALHPAKQWKPELLAVVVLRGQLQTDLFSMP